MDNTKSKIKEHINLVVIGHVDSGKSTTCGHLIYLLGGINQRDLTKLKEEAQQNGKQSFYLAYVMDKTKAERQRGITITSKQVAFQTENYNFTIIDAPGHRDFIKNMITGTASADVACLVLPATKGEFEVSISKSGQTREHALLAYTLGVKQMIVAINKMDDPSVNYSQQRYEEVKAEISLYLKKIGYKTESIPFIPISGFKGDNLMTKSENLAWYKGPTLVEALNAVIPPKRPYDKPLRVPISSMYKIQGIGTVAAGVIETGIMKSGQQVKIAPNDITSEIKSIEQHHEKLTEAKAGENVGFNLKNVNLGDIQKGMVCGSFENPPKACKTFIAQIIMMDHPKEVKAGYTPIISCHTAQVSCKFTQLLCKIDRKNGEILENEPKAIKNGDCAIVLMTPQKPLCVENFKDYPQLGRFAVRDMKQTVAVGIVKEIQYE